MNKVILMGRLTRDPEVRYSQGAEPVAVARYTLAVNRRTRRQGEQDADFIGCVAFGRAAEFAEKYFRKGTKIAVTGRIQTGSYRDKNGQTVYTTDVIANRVEFLGSRNNNGGGSNANSGFGGNDSYQGGQQQSAPAPQQDAFGGQDDFPDAFQAADDDIPF